MEKKEEVTFVESVCHLISLFILGKRIKSYVAYEEYLKDLEIYKSMGDYYLCINELDYFLKNKSASNSRINHLNKFESCDQIVNILKNIEF